MKQTTEAFLILMFALTMVSIQQAYAEPLSVEDFCTPGVNKEILKGDYKNHIGGINHQLEGYLAVYPSASKKDLSGFINNPSLERIGQKAACLKELGINPDSVAMFSPDLQEIFMDNYDELRKVAPTLVQHVTIPEYGSAVAIVLAISITSSILFFRKSFPWN